jgi:hypothetical protein
VAAACRKETLSLWRLVRVGKSSLVTDLVAHLLAFWCSCSESRKASCSSVQARGLGHSLVL